MEQPLYSCPMERNPNEQVTRCLRPGCGRKLSAPASVSRGYGPTCWSRIRHAAVSAEVDGFTEDQHAKALELIADGGIALTSRPGVYAAASSDGSTFYVVNLSGPGCTCAAGLHGRACYHLAAARILQAAAATTTTKKAA